jgi:hypothetical protein
MPLSLSRRTHPGKIVQPAQRKRLYPVCGSRVRRTLMFSQSPIASPTAAPS